MSFEPSHFRLLITRTLTRVDLYSPDAVELLMLTAATETHLGRWLKQIRGPAIGVYQCEPRTHLDYWRWLKRKRETDPLFYRRVTDLLGYLPDEFRLFTDLAYQTVCARIHYYMIPEPLPSQLDIEAMARYWDVHYNRNPDKGFPEQAVEDYQKYACKKTA